MIRETIPKLDPALLGKVDASSVATLRRARVCRDEMRRAILEAWNSETRDWARVVCGEPSETRERPRLSFWQLAAAASIPLDLVGPEQAAGNGRDFEFTEDSRADLIRRFGGDRE